MDAQQLSELLVQGEGERLEFKTSMNQGAVKEGIQSAVAFVNTDGGRVMFGVTNDGDARGVQAGKDTLEKLANKIRDHTYPSLHAHIDTVAVARGKKVVILDVPRDRPPLVGSYLYSSRALDPGSPVDPFKLICLRRVGRSNQTVDFMVLRQPLPTDPRIRLTTLGYDWSDVTDQSLELKCRIWIEEASGSAHQVSIESEPRIGSVSRAFDDFPYPRSNSSQGRWLEAIAPFEITAPALIDEPIERFLLIANYMDDWGLGWRSVREMRVVRAPSATGKDVIESITSGAFERRITSLPAKVARV